MKQDDLTRLIGVLARQRDEARTRRERKELHRLTIDVIRIANALRELEKNG